MMSLYTANFGRHHVYVRSISCGPPMPGVVSSLHAAKAHTSISAISTLLLPHGIVIPWRRAYLNPGYGPGSAPADQRGASSSTTSKSTERSALCRRSRRSRASLAPGTFLSLAKNGMLTSWRAHGCPVFAGTARGRHGIRFIANHEGDRVRRPRRAEANLRHRGSRRRRQATEAHRGKRILIHHERLRRCRARARVDAGCFGDRKIAHDTRSANQS